MVKTFIRGVSGGPEEDESRKSSSKDRSKRNKSPFKRLDASPSNCRICSEEMSGKSIGCDRCKGMMHLKCSQMPNVEFDFIHKRPKTKLLFYCPLCQQELADMGNQDDRIAANGAKIENITEIIKTISAQNQLILETINKEKQVEDNRVEKPENTIQETIKSNMKELLDDHKQKEDKKNNLIVFNIPEAKDDDKGVAEDFKIIKEILTFIDKDIVTPELTEKAISRVGNTKNKNDRPRPIKVEFPNPGPKNKALQNARSLRDFKKYPKMGISKDKSEQEMQKDRTLRGELTRLRALGGDWTIFDDTCVLRSDIPALRKAKAEDRNKNSKYWAKGGNSEASNKNKSHAEGNLISAVESKGGNPEKKLEGVDSKKADGGDPKNADQDTDTSQTQIKQVDGGNSETTVTEGNGGDSETTVAEDDGGNSETEED